MSRIAFDIGASYMRIAEITRDGIGRVHRMETPRNPTAAINAFAKIVEAMNIDVESVWGGIPAVVTEDGSVDHATNLPEWNGFPFAHALSRSLKVPVHVRNDAELNGLGEAVYGAGKNVRSVAYLGLGTGIGTSRIVDKNVEKDSSHGEARLRVIALMDGTTLEKRISGHALFKKCGTHPRDIPRAMWHKLSFVLAEGIENAICVWSPDLVVLGGSLMNEENGFQLEEVRKALKQHAPNVGTTPLRVSELKDASGLYGAKAWSLSFENA